MGLVAVTIGSTAVVAMEEGMAAVCTSREGAMTGGPKAIPEQKKQIVVFNQPRNCNIIYLLSD